MWRGVVHREVVVVLNLDPGEVEDMTKRYGSTVFAPNTLEIRFQWRDRERKWFPAECTVRGPRRLKSGGVSQSGDTLDYHWYIRNEPVPSWVNTAINANLPARVAADDLPIVPSATDLDGA